MGSLTQQNKTLRVFIFDTPRTNCHVFYKLFDKHPQLGAGGFFQNYSAPSLYGPERIQLRLRHGEEAEKTQIEWGTQYGPYNLKTYDDATKELIDSIDATEKEVCFIWSSAPVEAIGKYEYELTKHRRAKFSLARNMLSAS